MILFIIYAAAKGDYAFNQGSQMPKLKSRKKQGVKTLSENDLKAGHVLINLNIWPPCLQSLS